MTLSGGKRKVNKSLKSWVAFVKKVQKEEKLSYKDAIHRAKQRKDKGEKWMTGGTGTDPTATADVATAAVATAADPNINYDDFYNYEPTPPPQDYEPGPPPQGGRRRRRTMRRSRSRGRGRGRTARRARSRASRRY